MRTLGRLCVFVMLVMPLSIVVGCGGSAGGGTTPPPPTTYTIGGTVSGLTGTGLVLQDNGGNNLSVSASGSFTFSTAVDSGAAYSVTVLTQPTGQSCTVTSGSGTASANVTNVQVSCSNLPPTTYTIGGTVSGLTGTGLVLQDNGGNNLAVSASGSFTFSTAVASGAAYSVTVFTQPTGQSCTVTSGSGTASANVTNVQVACSNLPPTTYTIGGTVSGLIGTGLVLQDNGGNNLAVSASGAFTFSTAVASGAAYSVTVLTQPTGQTCTVTSGSGTASANVTNVQVTCSTTTYTIGGTVSGLTGTGLVLQDNGGNNKAVSASGSFIFSTAVDSGAAYSVTVLTQPTGQSCTVTNGSGTASANVANVQIACVGEWKWMGGGSTVGTFAGGQSGVYGTLGTAASTNIAGGRYFAMSWSDASGNLWLFGGAGFDATGTNGYLNDLWKFNPQLGTNGEWTWMSGSSTANQTGVYGTLETATSTNIPGGHFGSVTWIDASGNLWLFGGYGYDSTGAQGYLNDLWKFNPELGSNGEWNWMGGSSTVGKSGGGQSGFYGTLGLAASKNIPGGRYKAVSWIDASGNLWFFGGTGSDSTGTFGELNDLWKFDPALGATGEWTWMSGSSTVGSVNGGQSGVYGTLGTAASTNIPGGRDSAVSWIDASGNLWLFGGNGYDSTGTSGWLNDLWMFNPSTGTNGEWTWMGGSTSVGSGGGQLGVYGTLGIAASTNIPGGRFGAVSWIDASGNLWLFGGGGYGSTENGGALNDLWQFDPALGANGEWTWMGGSTIVGSNGGQSGVYGTLGTVAFTNIPGGREHAVNWIDALGNLWLFGGAGFDSTGTQGSLNDLWKYQTNLPSTTYTVGGTVSGLTGTGLVLQDNGGNNLAVSTNGSFTFSNSVASGAAYSVTVLTQPTGQSCTVSSGSGTASANVTNVQVTCSTTTYTIGGTISGLTASGLVLADGSQTVSPASGATSFTFPTAIASGSSYAVTVKTQPSGETCTITNGSGTASANVSSIQVTCSTTTYTIGGTVSGLTGTGLVLQDNGGNNLAVSASGSFTFNTAVASGSTYSVTVFTQPTGQSCSVTSGSGTASANVSNVQVTCSTTTYTIGGTVSGLTGTALEVALNTGGNISYSQVIGTGNFTLSNLVPSGSTYSVTVMTQPTGQNCTVTNGSGTASANVTNIQITCLNVFYSISGTVSGLTGTGLVLQDNGSSNLAVSTNGVFSFSNSVARSASYSVTVLTQPTSQTCTVTNGSGTASANVANVQVACSNLPPTTYTIGGTVSGLTGTGLVLQDNGGNNLAVSASCSFTFSSSLAPGAAYNVTVLTQPTGQLCTVTNGFDTASANVTSVQVACSTAYTIGGTVSGLTGTGLVLQDNGGSNLAVSTSGVFSFSNSVARSASYSVTVLTQPTSQTCTVTNGRGTASANVTNVQVACLNNTDTIGGEVLITGLSLWGLVLQNNGGDNVGVGTYGGPFTFPTPIANGAAYNVTVAAQPYGVWCSVSNGSGTAITNVTNIQVSCNPVSVYTIGGTVSGLGASAAITLLENVNGSLVASQKVIDGAFTFPAIDAGSFYSVTVQPQGIICAVTYGMGTVTANVTNIQVACTP